MHNFLAQSAGAVAQGARSGFNAAKSALGFRRVRGGDQFDVASMNSSDGSSDILSFMSTENSAASQEEMLASDDSVSLMSTATPDVSLMSTATPRNNDVSLMSTATPNEEEFFSRSWKASEFLNQTTGASTLDVDQVMQEYYGNHSEDVTSTGSSVSHLY